MSNRFDASAAGAATGVPKEDYDEEEAYTSQEPKHSNVKQANEITLKKGLMRLAEEEDFSENEHLLGGQRQQLQQSARVNFKEHGGGRLAAASAANCDDEDDETLQEPWQSSTMTQYGNTNNNTNSHSQSQLDIQKFPEEMQQQQQQQQRQRHQLNSEQNGTTIILTPTSLNATPGAAGITGDANKVEYAGRSAHDDRDNNHAEYKGPKFWRHLVKHWTTISQPLAILVIFLALWAMGYVLLPDYAQPHTVIMRIAFLFVGAQISGILVTFVRLPDMLGMLFFGVLYANIGLADFSGYQRFEAFLREMALINIMLLAGLGLDANAFKKLWFMILRLTLIPTIAEVAIITLLARFLLAMPWLWGILLGLVVTAVSPNVVVTVMLKLKEERLGMNSGIHTLIYAMTTCNDVVSIFVFGVILGVVFSTGTLTEQILQGPIGIGIGIVFGYVYGLMLQFLPSTKSPYLNGLRFVLTILGGSIAVMGSKVIEYPSAGALGCVTVAFIAGIGWKRQQAKLTPQQQQADENSSVAKRLDLLWKFLKPVSFALIGKEINFAVLDGKVVGYGALLVLVGSLFRLAFAYVSTYGGNLSWKERAYITISGFPKATVQAALGPIALDLARSLNADQENLSLASNVLVISVLAIIFTAPLGAILMLRLAPHWLQHSSSGDNDVGDGNGYNHDGFDDGSGRTNVLMNSSKFAQNLGYINDKDHNAPAVDVVNVDGSAAAGVDGGGSTKAARHLV